MKSNKKTQETRCNFQIIFNNQIVEFMEEGKNVNNYDLEDRTIEFSKRVIRLCRELKKDCVNTRLISQVIGSSGSVGANYREANDALGDKDFLHRMKISRKEAKEALYWLELIEEANPSFINRMQDLKQEAKELKYILSAIINKKTKK